MFIPVLARVVLMGFLVVAVATVMLAQAPPGSAEPVIPELLAEVRALRAELNQAAGASMRMQLLLARLTLQEQRIAAAGRQLAEVQTALSAVINERADTESELRRLRTVSADGSLPPEAQRQIQGMVPALQEELARKLVREQELRVQEAEMLTLVGTEQGRWMEFNARLDELERALPAPSR